jgi:hypothetical protein
LAFLLARLPLRKTMQPLNLAAPARGLLTM